MEKSNLLEPVERSLRVPLRLFLMVRTMQGEVKTVVLPTTRCSFSERFTSHPHCPLYCTMEDLNPTTFPQAMPVVVCSRLYGFWLYAVVLRVYTPFPLLPITGRSVYRWGNCSDYDAQVI